MHIKKMELHRLGKLKEAESSTKKRQDPFDLQSFVVFIAKLIPIITLIAVIASSVKLAIFYDIFGIKIVDFIGVTEYLPLFIDELHGLLKIIGSLFLGVLIFKVFKMKPHSEQVYENRRESKSFRVFSIVITVMYVIGIALYLFLKFDTISERLEPLGGVYIGLLVLLFFISTSYDLNKGSSTIFLSIILSIPIVPLLISGYTEAYTILDNRNEYEYTVIFENESIIGNSETHFLGRSEDYIFFYNSNEKKAIVKTSEKLKEMHIIQKSK